MFEAAAAVLGVAVVTLIVYHLRVGRSLRNRFDETERDHLQRLHQIEQREAALRSSAERVPALEARIVELQAALGEKGEQGAAAQARVGELEVVREELRRKVGELDEEVRNKSTQLERLSTELREREQAWAVKRSELEDLHKSMRDQFEALAGRLLEEKGERFSKQHTEGLTRLLQPFREQLDGFRKEFGAAHSEEQRAQVLMNDQLKRLMNLNENLADEAKNLTRALTGQGRVRGEWGETVTEKLLQHAGLLEGQHYRRQETGVNEHGKRLQPDFVVQLPDRRHVVIDSKVALVAYHRFCGEEGAEEQRAHLDAHCTALRAQINELAAKDYPSLYGFEACEAVVMCIPTDGALLDALRHDPEIAGFAQERRVCLASPSLLQPMLVIINQMWRIDAQHRNAEEMARRVGVLCDKLTSGLESFEDVGRQLERALDSFSTARGRLYEGKGNVLRQHELLRELGAPAKKQLPTHLSDLARAEVIEALSGETAGDRAADQTPAEFES